MAEDPPGLATESGRGSKSRSAGGGSVAAAAAAPPTTGSHRRAPVERPGRPRPHGEHRGAEAAAQPRGPRSARSVGDTLSDVWFVRSMSLRRRGCAVDADCLRTARCLRRLPPVDDPAVPRYAAVCRCVHAGPGPPGPADPHADGPGPPGPGPGPHGPADGVSSTADPAANMTRGHCMQTRVLGQPCQLDIECSPGMVCSLPDSLCECGLGLHYSRSRARCEADLRRDPWTLDLPPIADMDAEVVETIPATYDCPLLVGMISVVLVLICLVVAAYCRFTDPPPKPPGYRPARTEREEGEPFEWSDASPLRFSSASDLSSLRRVKQCSCELAQTLQASMQASQQAPTTPPPGPSAGPSTGTSAPGFDFSHPLAQAADQARPPMRSPRMPRTPRSDPQPQAFFGQPSAASTSLVQLPPLPPLRDSVRLYLQQVPTTGTVR